jgi:hypothetical protein
MAGATTAANAARLPFHCCDRATAASLMSSIAKAQQSRDSGADNFQFGKKKNNDAAAPLSHH